MSGIVPNVSDCQLCHVSVKLGYTVLTQTAFVVDHSKLHSEQQEHVLSLLCYSPDSICNKVCSFPRKQSVLREMSIRLELPLASPCILTTLLKGNRFTGISKVQNPKQFLCYSRTNTQYSHVVEVSFFLQSCQLLQMFLQGVLKSNVSISKC